MRFITTRLNTLLVTVFAVIIIAVVGGLVAVTDRHMTALSSDEANDRFDAVASAVSQRMRTSFDPGFAMLDAVAALPIGQMEPLVAADVIRSIMRNGASRSSAVNAIQIGRSDGSAVIVVKLDEAQRKERRADYATKLVSVEGERLVQRTVFYDASGRELYRLDATPSDFDARTRPWYRAALGSDAVVATRPYHYIGGYNVVGVTVARRSLSDPGVILGIDITSKGLSEALATLQQASGADLLVFDPDDRFVVGAGDAAVDGSDDQSTGASTKGLLRQAVLRDYQDHGPAGSGRLSMNGPSRVRQI